METSIACILQSFFPWLSSYKCRLFCLLQAYKVSYWGGTWVSKRFNLETNDLFGVGMFYHLLTSSAEAVELGDPPNLAVLREDLSAFIMKESTRVRRTIWTDKEYCLIMYCEFCAWIGERRCFLCVVNLSFFENQPGACDGQREERKFKFYKFCLDTPRVPVHCQEQAIGGAEVRFCNRASKKMMVNSCSAKSS